jgi:enamine deaminase RidA (YjgF/YER057c/UK114 family)
MYVRQCGVAVSPGVNERQERVAGQTLVAVLAADGMTNATIIKATMYLIDVATIGPFMAVGQGTLPDPPPATTLLVVAQLADPRLLVEIEAIAVTTTD